MKKKLFIILVVIAVIHFSPCFLTYAQDESGGLGLEQSVWEKSHLKTDYPKAFGQAFDGKYNVQYTELDKTYSKQIVESFRIDVSAIKSTKDLVAMVDKLTPTDKKLIEQYKAQSGNDVSTYYSEKLKKIVKDCPFINKNHAGYFTVYLSFGASKKLNDFSIFLGKNPR